eukprot:COSAG04_NODE_1451_length_6686_cov_13.172435_4_plen_173_part_00
MRRRLLARGGWGAVHLGNTGARSSGVEPRGGGGGWALGAHAPPAQSLRSSCPDLADLRFLAAGSPCLAAGGPSPGWGGVGWCIAVQQGCRRASGAGSGRLGPRAGGRRPRGRRTVPEQRARAGAGPRAAAPRTSTGEKNEKKRAGRMSRTQAEIDCSGSILGGSKLSLGCAP